MTMEVSSSSSPEWKELPATPGPSGLFLRIIQESSASSMVAAASSEDGPRAIHSDDTVLINIVGRQADKPQHSNGPIFQQAKSWLVTVGEPFSTIRPVELALLQMQQGQTAQVYVEASSRYHPFGTTTRRKYHKGGDQEPYTLPTGSSLLYEITAIQIVMDTSRLNPYFPIQKALTMKNMANDLYQNEWQLLVKQENAAPSTSRKNSRERAIYLYEKAAKSMTALLDGTYFANVEPDHPQRKQCKTILMDSRNNVTAVYLRAKRWKQAREAAKLALKDDAKNPKAQLRNVKAHVLDPHVDVEEAEQALEKAEGVICYKDAEEKELKQLRMQWNRKMKNDRKSRVNMS